MWQSQGEMEKEDNLKARLQIVSKETDSLADQNGHVYTAV